MDQKDSIRGIMRARRNALARPAVLDAGERVAFALERLRLLDQASALMAYSEIGAELPAAPAVRAAHGRGLPVGLPVGRAGGFCLHPPGGKLKEGAWGVAEPVTGEAISVDRGSVVLMPLLACAPPGIRLGQGGGWYDRAADHWPATALRVGLGYEFQLVDELPQEAWDVPVHLTVTERRVVVWQLLKPWNLPGKEETDRDGIFVHRWDEHRLGGRVRVGLGPAAQPSA